MRPFPFRTIFAAIMAIGIVLLPGCKDQPITPVITPTDTSGDVKLTAPGPGQGFQIVLGPFDIPAGQEIQKNFYQKLPLDSEAYVTMIQIVSNKGGRYVNVFKSDMEDVSVHVEDSFVPMQLDRWDLIAPAIGEDYTLRMFDAAAMYLAPHQQVNFQVHCMNTGTSTARGKVIINIWTTIAKKNVKYPMGILNAGLRDVTIPSHTSATYCKVIKAFDKDVQIMLMTGRFNSHGKVFTLGRWDSQKQQLKDTIYINRSSEKPTVLDLACGATIKAGDSLAFVTTYENPTANEVSFGPHITSEEQGCLYLFYSPSPLNSAAVYDFSSGFMTESHPL